MVLSHVQSLVVVTLRGQLEGVMESFDSIAHVISHFQVYTVEGSADSRNGVMTDCSLELIKSYKCSAHTLLEEENAPNYS